MPDLGNYSKKSVIVVEPVVIIGPNCGREIIDFKSITLVENFSIFRSIFRSVRPDQRYPVS